jgi:nicotinamidase/pyrazinamidase
MLSRPLIFQNKSVDRNLIETVRKYQQIIIEKQTLDVFSNPMTERILRALPPRAIVFGVATEYCVRLACLGLRQRGVQTALVTDAIRAITLKGETEALEEMRKAGVEFITLETLTGAN